MMLEVWFPTPIWYDYVNCDFEKIKKRCLDIRQNMSSRMLSNFGGWQSENIKLADYEEFHELAEMIDKHLNDVCDEIRELSPDFNAKMDNLWININGPNDYNTRHTHPGGVLSGTIYIDVDEYSGDLVFSNPSLIHHYPLSASKFFDRAVKYKPKVGLMVIFPSWIEHEVRASPGSNQDRISISFNFKEITKD